MGVRSRSSSKRRRRAATVSIGDGRGDNGNGGGVDLISGLSDDLLVRILDLVPDAADVVRTHALSRRWRGLWTGVAALRFDFSIMSKHCMSDAAAERFLAFVNGALALRATANKQPAFVEDLAISFDIYWQETGQLVPLSVEAAQGWIRYAVLHALKSFVLKLMLPWRWRFIMKHPVITVDEMDNFAKMETMHLRLGGAELRLPSSTVVFPSLVDLSLEDIEVPAGGGYFLSRLLSSACCPRLHKLHLRHLSFEPSTMEVMLRIDSEALLELSIDSVFELQFLELRTPSLQILHIVDDSYLKGFTISAPRLENLGFMVQRPVHIDGQLSSVGTLKIQMFSHGETDDEDRNNASFHLLQCCRLTNCLEVSFEIPKTKDQTIDIIKGRIPLLPYVTHLTVHIQLWERHSTGPGLESLLAQCRNIKYLSLQLLYIIKRRNLSELDLLCDNNSCHWKSHEFSLSHLQKVKFKNFIGTDCEFQFIQSILTKATEIQKVTISFDRLLYWQKGRKDAFKLVPPLDGGLWTSCKDAELSYKWRRCL